MVDWSLNSRRLEAAFSRLFLACSLKCVWVQRIRVIFMPLPRLLLLSGPVSVLRMTESISGRRCWRPQWPTRGPIGTPWKPSGYGPFPFSLADLCELSKSSLLMTARPRILIYFLAHTREDLVCVCMGGGGGVPRSIFGSGRERPKEEFRREERRTGL